MSQNQEYKFYIVDGHMIGLYTDDIMLPMVGKLEVQRLSDVEYDNAAQGWRVEWRQTNILKMKGPVSPLFQSREEAIAWEVAQANSALAAMQGTVQ